ncbi:unnamed protein product, partial [Mesorhabditis spiculigera]
MEKQMEGRQSEGLKTVIAFLCLTLAAFMNFFLLTVIHDIVPREPLPDIVFLAIPQQRWAWSFGDVLSTVSSVMAFTVVLLHRDRVVVLRRMFVLGAILYGLRAVILGVTYLPPSFHNRDQICQPQVNRTALSGMEIATRFLTYVVTLGLTSGQDKILCGDLMFSGHTVVLTIMYFVQLQYTPRGLVILRYIAAPITFLGIAALVVSGGHYTMDVLIAYWLTSHVFWGYHQMFELPKEKRPHAPMSRLWWFWMCNWLESDVPDGPLENVPVNKGPFEKDMDMGIADDFMPAYIVRAIRVDKAEMPCNQQGISAPQINVTLVAKDSSSQEAEVPLPCLYNCKVTFLLHANRMIHIYVYFQCPDGQTSTDRTKLYFPLTVAVTELPIDQEEAIADAEFPDYKRYLDDFVKETCGAANTCKVPKGVCQKSAPGLQLAFQARNVTNVRRVAQVLVEDKNPKKLFACGTSGVCRTYATKGWVLYIWWGNSRMLTKAEIDDWMVKTKNGAGLIERFRAKIFAKKLIGPHNPSEFDIGLADDVMPAYNVWVWEDNDWKKECTGEMASAPELGGQIRHLEWHDIQNRIFLGDTFCVHFSFFF